MNLEITRGNPTSEELAALTVALLAAVPSSSVGSPPAGRSPWGNRATLVRRPLHPGPGAWRTSGLPS
ncbi:acyl-CoA carboxylase subunit epsilon [Saccharothrix violaceirubra]|uniref:acyl-CoA carboxylase subunit epsilon n=1 Tax=Saccharothrix violaceirubra TaxID=413306 RepID=UPI00161204AD|nr:acyl-CoA carboxylase subunit epsilon [Saccharothrix violaceirubra]